MKKIYVLKVYKTGIASVVEEFPQTDEGLNDAYKYVEIMNRNKEYKHIVCTQVTD